jgi:hypothetical protein
LDDLMVGRRQHVDQLLQLQEGNSWRLHHAVAHIWLLQLLLLLLIQMTSQEREILLLWLVEMTPQQLLEYDMMTLHRYLMMTVRRRR